jgi:type I restriction enzyme M protein
LGNKLPAILNDFKNLKDFILDKANNGEILQMNESIVPFFEEFEEANEKDSLSSMLERLETLIVHAITSVDATGSIVKADKDSMKPEKLDLNQFLQEITGYYRFEDRFKIKIEHTQDEPGKDSHFYVLADKAQLTTLFTNLIENAARHGFVEQKKYQIVFCIALSADKKYVVIDYKNDGLPFSDSFSFQDFISYGRYAGSKGNSGIGGYLINQIVENHDGKIFYREKINKRDPFNVRFEIFLPNKIIQ